MLMFLLSDLARDQNNARQRLADDASEILDAYGIAPEHREMLRGCEIDKLAGQVAEEARAILQALAGADEGEPVQKAPPRGWKELADQFIGKEFFAGQFPWPLDQPMQKQELEPNQIQPSEMKKGQGQNVKVTGRGIPSGSVLLFRRPGQEVVASGIQVASSGTWIRGDVTFSTAARYDVVVRRPDSQEWVCIQGMNVKN